jgi:hypothetical protein
MCGCGCGGGVAIGVASEADTEIKRPPFGCGLRGSFPLVFPGGAVSTSADERCA